MKKQLFFIGALVLGLSLTTIAITSLAHAREPKRPEPVSSLDALGTAFTYQGKLETGAGPINETCALTFRLYSHATTDSQVGDAITASVPITDGLFTVNLDFGAGAFAGDARWLGVKVKCPDDTTYADLGRQELTAAPYALYAMGAPWDGLTGVPGGFADGVDDVGLTDVAWTDVLSRPAGLDDGDDDTTYSTGAGLLMVGTEMSVDFTAVAPFTHTHSLTATDELKYFEQEALIPTHGACDWEAFTIDDDSYLAIANEYNGTTHNVDSEIYRWTGTGFTASQSISTSGATDWKFFTINGDHYLAVANIHNDASYNVDSKIYWWNGTSFAEFQSIPTNGAEDWEFFTIDNDHYLAVANYYNGSTHNINSKIYKWVGDSFAEFQSIPTNGAFDWEFFTIGSDHYLAVANHYNDSTCNINSTIYKWNGASFVAFQSISTSGATDWKFFTINGDHYLAVANIHNDASYNVDSKIYWWNGTSFATVQSIPTNGAEDLEFFTIGEDHYLAVANYFNDSTRNINSKLYRWNGTYFVESQSIPTHGAIDWAFFTIGSDHYLAVANLHNDSTFNVDSAIYRAALASQAGTTYLWGQSGSHAYYDAGHVGVGTTSPQSALQVEGYIQLDTLTAAPPASDCDEASERGRMKVDTANGILYVCVDSGWISLTP